MKTWHDGEREWFHHVLPGRAHLACRAMQSKWRMRYSASPSRVREEAFVSGMLQGQPAIYTCALLLMEGKGSPWHAQQALLALCWPLHAISPCHS